MLDTEWNAVVPHAIDLYPADLQTQIDGTIDAIYQPINNGVYRAGFATQQAAYDEAVTDLFAALDHWEAVLDRQQPAERASGQRPGECGGTDGRTASGSLHGHD